MAFYYSDPLYRVGDCAPPLGCGVTSTSQERPLNKLLLLVISAVMCLTLACEKKADDKAAAAAGADKAAAAAGAGDEWAKSDEGKAWAAWKDEACKCADIACASAIGGDKRLAIENKFNPGKGPSMKAAGLIDEANACLDKALKAPPAQ